MTPPYLYKIVDHADWQKSQEHESVVLPAADTAFIHFSLEEQLERIITKYWGSVPLYVVLKVETEKLPGRLVFETNPGGTAKYYHLYDGSIPLEAVAEAKLIQSQ